MRPAIALICGQHLCDILRALSQQLLVQLVAFPDQRPKVITPRGVHGIIKDISQRRAEDPLTPPVAGKEGICLTLPRAGLLPVLGACPAAWSLRPPKGAAGKPLVAGFSLAVVAFNRDLLAPFPRVERVVRPFDFRLFSHCRFPSRLRPSPREQHPLPPTLPGAGIRRGQ